MFTRILQWIREVWLRMINRTDIKSALRVDVALSETMAAALQKWTQIYTNKAPWLTNDVKSLNLGATIAAEIARAVTIEMEVKLDDASARAKYLQGQLAPVLLKLREQVEYGVAKGGLMMKPYVSGGSVVVDFVQADQFYPVEFDASGRITSCVFSDQRTIGQYFYTRLELHKMVGTDCEIRNTAFRSLVRDTIGTEVPLTEVQAWKDLQPEATIKNIKAPLFAYFRYPMANSIDPTSPLGVSCFSRAIDLLEQADGQWSQLLWEFESGKRALYADTQAFEKGPDNKPILPIKRLYRTLNSTGNVGEKGKLFEEWTPTLREANILAGLDAILKHIEFTCGLAQGTISDPNTITMTATEIKMSKQRTYATITDTQKALQVALDQLLAAMDTWATIGKLAPKGKYEATYEFDDSIVADHDTQFTQDSQAVSMQVMPKWVFLVRNYGLSEEEAKAQIADVQADVKKETYLLGLNDQGGGA